MVNNIDVANYQTACSRLDEIAQERRRALTITNVYSNTTGNIYGVTHPNATQAVGDRDPDNIRGKGTGQFLDTNNGGSSLDINGTPDFPNSGRVGTLFLNYYNRTRPYECRLDQ